MFRHGEQCLRDRVRRGGFFNLDARGIPRDLRRELNDRSRQRRGKQHRLAFARQLRNDAANVRQKADIEHPVGFVEHEHLQARRTSMFLRVEVIEQTSRRGDDNVNAAAQSVGLIAHRHAAKNRGDAQIGARASMRRLVRQLARRVRAWEP